MNVLIILGHPDSKSFNHALADACKTQLIKNGHSVCLHDLYKEQFNPVLQLGNLDTLSADNDIIRTHQTDLTDSDGIIIIHPNWWGQPPAIVKGWLDCILLPDIAYKFEIKGNGELMPVGLLKAQIALVLNTSNTSEELENQFYKDPLETIWKNRVFSFCGINQFERKNFRVIKDSDMRQRSIWLSDACLMIDKYFSKV